MDVSRSPDPVTSYSRFLYHVPPACVLVRFLPVLLVPLWIVDSSMLTGTAYALPFVVCRLVSRLIISGL